MTNQDRCHELYEEINGWTLDDTFQMVLNSQNKDEQDFFGAIGNYLLQKRQKKILEQKVFLGSYKASDWKRLLNQ